MAAERATADTRSRLPLLIGKRTFSGDYPLLRKLGTRQLLTALRVPQATALMLPGSAWRYRGEIGSLCRAHRGLKIHPISDLNEAVQQQTGSLYSRKLGQHVAMLVAPFVDNRKPDIDVDTEEDDAELMQLAASTRPDTVVIVLGVDASNALFRRLEAGEALLAANGHQILYTRTETHEITDVLFTPPEKPPSLHRFTMYVFQKASELIPAAVFREETRHAVVAREAVAAQDDGWQTVTRGVQHV
jgi:hypothetical protein